MRTQTKPLAVLSVLVTAWCFAQPATISVTVPDYAVGKVGDVDEVTIPGGRLLVDEDGTPVVPYYVKSVSIPDGFRVRSVELKGRSGMKQESGLVLPIVQPDLGPAAKPVPGRFPKEEFAWTATYDGKPMLYLSIYAVSYDPKTTELTFHQDHEFDVTYVRSDLRVAGVTTDRAAYEPGDTVFATASVESGGGTTAAKAILRASAQGAPPAERRDVSAEVRFEAPDTVELAWPTRGVAAGLYDVEFVVQDVEGNELERTGTTVRLGIPGGEVTGFEAKPVQFRVGDDINLELVFKNTGSVELRGECVFRIQEGGELVEELRVEMPGTAPGKTRTFREKWNTDDAAKSVVYTAVGFVEYEGMASEPARVAFSTNRMPTAVFEVPADTVAAGEGVVFDGAGSMDGDGRVVEFRWEFGDGAKAEGARVEHTFRQPGDFLVRLTAVDNEGGTGTAERTVTVIE